MTMNVIAYHPNDGTKKFVHIDDWVVKYGPTVDGCCRICNSNMYVKADKSQKQTHFAHYKNSCCPTVIDNHKPYDSFKNLPRDFTISASAKNWTIQHVDAIYNKLRKFVALSWKEFHGLLEVANREDIWSLKEMPHDCIPYVLLACTEKFEANKLFKRNYAKYFVLEPSPDPDDFWNSSELQKKYIWEIELPSRKVKHYEIELETQDSWYMRKVVDLLK